MWSAWWGSQTLWTSNRTSQVRKIVHNFCYTKSEFHAVKCKKNLIFFCTRLGSLQFSRLTQATEVWTQSRRVFRFFLQLFEVMLETTANPEETLTQWLVQKNMRVFCTLWHEIWLIITKVMNDSTGSGNLWTPSCWPCDWTPWILVPILGFSVSKRLKWKVWVLVNSSQMNTVPQPVFMRKSEKNIDF